MKKYEFHYIKSATHQEIKVDGAHGGVSPTGDSVTVSVYTERNPIPQLVVHEMKELEDGKSELGKEIVDLREGRQGVVRIVQATLHMNLEQAKAVNLWLEQRIADLESLEKKND